MKRMIKTDEFEQKDLYSKFEDELRCLAEKGDGDAKNIIQLWETPSEVLFEKVKSENEDALFVFAHRWMMHDVLLRKSQDNPRALCDLDRLTDLLELGGSRGHIGLKVVLGLIYKYGFIICSSNPPNYSKSYVLFKDAAKHQCKMAYDYYEEIKTIIYRMSEEQLSQQIAEKFDVA